MKRLLYFLLGLLFIQCNNTTFVNNDATITASVDFSKEGKEFPIYWNSTGFSPADFFKRQDMQLALAYYGTSPNNGIKWIRPHYMLNLIGTEGIRSDNPKYNWTRFDQAFDQIINNGMKPIFEIMGYPSLDLLSEPGDYNDAFQGLNSSSKKGRFKPDYTNKEDLLLWKRFVKDVALHLIERYGEEEVLSWYFEVQNEPDIKFFSLESVEELLNYYDATSEGLKAAHKKIIFGGPGTAKGLSKEFKALLAHCDTGTNILTGEKGVRLDFISVHRKFLPKSMVDWTAEIIKYISDYHPKFNDTPFMNDEADPMAGWSKWLWWRADTWYAAFIPHCIDLHNQLIIDDLNNNFVILSNDNAFMGNWYQRTHFARFTNNKSLSDSIYLIKQPVYTVMHMLASMGKTRYDVKGFKSGGQNAGIIATKRDNGDIVLLAYNKPVIGLINNNWESEDSINSHQHKMYNAQSEVLSVQLNNLPNASNLKYTEYRLDNNNGNAYAKWVEMGKPELPTTKQFIELSEVSDPVISTNPKEMKTSKNSVELSIDLQEASVAMIVLSDSKRKEDASSVGDLRIREFTGLNGEKMNFVSWDGVKDENLKGYKVSCTYDGETFEDISNIILEQGFLHIPKNENVQYSVKTIHY